MNRFKLFAILAILSIVLYSSAGQFDKAADTAARAADSVAKFDMTDFDTLFAVMQASAAECESLTAYGLRLIQYERKPWYIRLFTKKPRYYREQETQKRDTLGG